MIAEETNLKGCFVMTPKVFRDSRGEFYESFNKKRFEELTHVKTEFVQDNQSVSQKHTLRGLHFQAGEHQQAKLVRVTQGVALDVCVDIRENSETFGQHFSIVLDSKSNQQLFVPKGFAHGFLALSETVVFNYKCDNYYNKESERGIIFNDPQLNIDWGFSEEQLILSDKDKQLPTLNAYLNEKKD